MAFNILFPRQTSQVFSHSKNLDLGYVINIIKFLLSRVLSVIFKSLECLQLNRTRSITEIIVGVIQLLLNFPVSFFIKVSSFHLSEICKEISYKRISNFFQSLSLL